MIANRNLKNLPCIDQRKTDMPNELSFILTAAPNKSGAYHARSLDRSESVPIFSRSYRIGNAMPLLIAHEAAICLELDIDTSRSAG